MTINLVLGWWDVVALLGIIAVSHLIVHGGLALLRSRLESRGRRLAKAKRNQEYEVTEVDTQHSSVRPTRGSLPPPYLTFPKVIGLENFDRNDKPTWRPPKMPKFQY